MSRELSPGPARAIASGREEGVLLRRLRRGDRDAANELIESSYELVFASLFRLVGGDRELAADLTQETYRKAWHSIDRFDGRSRFATWLYRIAYNTFLNHVRRPHPVRSLDDETVAEQAGDGPGPDQEMGGREEAEQLRRAVLALPEELRYTVTARFWGELRARDIARQEGVTTAAVRKRLKRAYLMLEIALGEAGP